MRDAREAPTPTGRNLRQRKDAVEHLRKKSRLTTGERGLMAADKAIDQLQNRAPRCALALELAVFRRMSPRRIARTLNRTEDTINRDLGFARAALRLNLRTENSGSDD